MQKTALLIDHDDSFIWNIKSWLEPDLQVTIVNHSALQQLKDRVQFVNAHDLIILSPGPKSPQDYPYSLQILQETSHRPFLGICLGFQMMTFASGGTVQIYFPPQHGKTSPLRSEFSNFNNLKVGRYHSLKCEPSADFQILARSQDDDCVMWAQHKFKKQLGFQFHPESFLTESAELYKQYLLDWI